MSQEDDDQKIGKRQFWAPLTPEARLLELIEKLSARVDVNAQESSEREDKNGRNIDFIIQQQAQFAADMQQMREAQVQAEEKWERRWSRTEGSIRDLLAIVQIQSQEIGALAEAQSQLSKVQADAQERTDKQMSETNERLNALVNVVERIISERRDGGAGDDQNGAR